MSFKDSYNEWYRIHSSLKHDAGFMIAVIFGFIILSGAAVAGLIILGQVFPYLGWAMLSGLVGSLVVWWCHYIFSIKNDRFKPVKQKEYDKKSRAPRYES